MIEIESTNQKACIKGAAVEVQPQGSAMFKDISVCGDWCTSYSKKYNTCIDYALKELKIQKIVKELEDK